MTRRCTLLLLILTLLTAWTCAAQADTGEQAQTYQSAQERLIGYFNGEVSDQALGEICADFESLGWYHESISYRYYAAIVRDVMAGFFDRIDVYLELVALDTDFCAMLTTSELPALNELEAYARGRMAEAALDMELALAYYRKCGAILDSQLRMERALLPAAEQPALQPYSAAEWNQQGVVIGNFVVLENPDGTCTIQYYVGSAKALSISTRLGISRVTSIGPGAFLDCADLTRITLPEGVVSIGTVAFSGCTGLTAIRIPQSVVSIGRNAFANCPNLTLRVAEGSYAQQYAIDNQLPYTTY